ncbi:FG-GAP repeat domain-containing protein [Phyllobacterium leguminum]|uniref:Aldos-2-ulose dehydratase beta-propeller domain-containing protein n=1 Tax=Phyllobacterium leguminum TaxID=314237 RepID=A0A318SZJ2_9HYPH|nr:VCBS repeat-containing protein [Phyllobacterium leguminum]PYE87546.1 hypothetical protein C7477_11247 [Phyllobacterium leguminum]
MSNGEKLSQFTPPAFRPEIIAEHLRSAYWIEAMDLDQDGRIEFIGHGMSLDEIYSFRKERGDETIWRKHLVASGVNMPVGMDQADITGNGYPDLIVCYDLYGEAGTFKDPSPDGGKIDWLENPGATSSSAARWNRHYIGQVPAAHRVKIGHFTQTERLEVLCFPIVSCSGTHGVLDITLFTQPDDVYNAESWPSTVIDNSYFRFVHGVEKHSDLIPGSNLDSVIVSSDEGVTWLFYNEWEKIWRKVPIGSGEFSQIDRTHFKGTGDADVGRIGGDRFAYVAAIEPFHGNTVAVYVKDGSAGTGQTRWQRHVLDIYSEPNSLGESPGHSVLCADFDGDGDDEFLVGLRGPHPWQGVLYYKAVDIAKGAFTKWKVGTESVARIIAGDFSGSGRIDFATIGYSIKNYYEAPNPKIVLYHNLIGEDR